MSFGREIKCCRQALEECFLKRASGADRVRAKDANA